MVALVQKDGVYDYTTSTSTGAKTLANTPPPGYRTFSDVCAVHDGVQYRMRHLSATEWEDGIGVITATHQLTPLVVTASSNGGAAVNFSPGTKEIYLPWLAETMPQKMDFYGATSDTNIENGARIETILTDTTAGSEDFSLAFSTMGNGTLRQRMRLDGDGGIRAGDQFGPSTVTLQLYNDQTVGQLNCRFDGNANGFLINQSSSGGDVSLNNQANAGLRFATNNQDRLILDSAGNLSLVLDGAVFNIGNFTGAVGGGNGNAIEVWGNAANEGSLTLGMFNATAATASRLDFYRSKNATIGSATVVASGDRLGEINFYGAQQTGTFATQNPAAAIRVEVDGTVTSGASADMPGRLLLLTTPDGSGTLAERVRIDDAGNVILGTAALATNATDGFFYLDSCAGTPSGTPTAYTGRVPLIYDTTNDKFYVNNSSWKEIGENGQFTGWTQYTPTVTPGSGSFTSVSATARYKTVGKTVFLTFNVTFTTLGTANAGWFFSLPGGMTMSTTTGTCGCAREAVSAGWLWQAFAAPGGATTITFFRADNNSTLVQGMSFEGAVFFEIQ